MDKYYIIAFNSTNEAILSEKVILDKNINARIIPLPTEITASCGLSLRIEADDLEKAIVLLGQNNITFEVYFVVRDGFKKNIKKHI